MSNIPTFGVLSITLLIFIFSVVKIRKEKLSVKKYMALILLPPILVVVGSDIYNVFSDLFHGYRVTIIDIRMFFLIIIYGLIIMFPALMFYAIHTLSLEKRFSPSKWKLFIWTGLLGGVSTLPYIRIVPWQFIFIPIITGSLSMMIVYFVSNRKK